MGCPSIRSRRFLLCAAVLVLSLAAASSEHEAAREARTAIDRARFDDARKIIDDALARFGSRDSESVWSLRVMRGEMIMSTQGLDAAARALSFALPAKYARSRTAVHLAILRALAARKPEMLDAAEKLARANQPALLGDVFLYRTSMGGTEQDARSAIRLSRVHKRPVTEAKAIANLAWFLGNSQRYPEAVEEGERAVSLARKLQLPKLQQTAEGNLGWAYFELGDYESAADLFGRAEKTARDLGVKLDRVPWLIQLGNIEYQKRNWEAAIRFNAQATALAEEVGRDADLGSAFANIARASLEQGRVDEAARFNARAVAAKKNDRDAILSSKVVEARIAGHRGDRAAAERLFEEVLRESPELPTRLEAETHLAELLVAAGRTDAARTHFASAARAAFEGRARIRNRDLRFAFLSTAADLFDAYVEFLVRSGQVEEALRVTETSRAQALEEGMRVSRTFDASAIAKANGATFLCYWLGRERSFVWVVTPSEVRVHALAPDARIEQAAKAYREELLGPGGSLERSGARGRQLYGMLVPPLRLDRNARVIVVPDGQLHTLNFETLVTPAGRYWIEDAVVISAPSLQLVARGAKKKRTADSILVVGDAPPAGPSFPRLRHARAEIDRVARHFATRTVLQGAQATPDAYRSASSGRYDIQHFVAHGVASNQRPLDSAVILAAGKNGTFKLLAREIMERPLETRLVTISSCHGVGTRTYAGEGVVGLAWAFLKAGADQVIAALWEVSDQATPALMDAMYAGIRKGRDPADALRDAKLSLIRQKNVHRNARYWAPFVLYAGT
jgi:CHAT domain-containing protein